MTISTKTLGPNSYRIDYDDVSEIRQKIIPTICAAILSGDHGWEMHHDPSPGNDSAKVLKALCEDGTTYKYVRLQVNTYGGDYMVRLQVGDGAADGSTSLQNIAADDAGMGNSHWYDFHQRISNYNGPSSMFVFAHPRWLVLFAQINDSSGRTTYGNGKGSWTGCIEFREDLGASGPSFAWAEGYHMAGHIPYLEIRSQYNPEQTWCFSTPRSGSGSTSNTYRYERNAIGHPLNMLVRYYQPVRTWYCSYRRSWTYYTYYRAARLEHDSRNKATKSERPMVIVPHAIEHTSARQLRGPFFGLKLALGGYGVLTSVLPVKTDASFFPHRKGTAKDHMIIGSATDRYMIPL